MSRMTSEEVLEQLRQNYPNGFPDEQTLEKAIHAIARHHAQAEAGSFKGVLALILLGVLAYSKFSLPVPQMPKLMNVSQQTSPALTKSASFEPLKVATPFLIDNSPPGSWDFTISRNGQTKVDIPSPCAGTINRIWFQGVSGNLSTGRGAGQITQVACQGKSYGWLIAHTCTPHVKQGQQVPKGYPLAPQCSTGRSSGDHVHAQIHKVEGNNWGERITDRATTAPIVESYLAFIRKGQ